MLHPREKKSIDKWTNSFMRPLVPYNLMDKSTIKKTHDDGAKLVYVKFLYGLKTGKAGSIPFDGTFGNKITNIDEESFWIYGKEKYIVPEGFVEREFDEGRIRTGTTRKCARCKGQGLIRCTSCNGKIRWHETRVNGDRIEKICSCGNGKQNCGVCAGYGDTEDVINVKTSFKVDQTKNSQYTGEITEKDIKKVTGEMVYEHQFEYPVALVEELLVGGLEPSEMNQLNDAVLKELRTNMEAQLLDSDIDTEVIYSQLTSLFDGINQLAHQNKVLTYEFMPVRVLVRVENAPVKQIDYSFKEKPFSIWVYGSENKVWCRDIPKTFNVKVGVILGSILALVSVVIVLNS